MKKFILFSILLSMSIATFSQAKQEINLVPIPAKIQVTGGQFTLDANTKIALSPDTPEMRQAVETLVRLLRRAGDLRIETVDSQPASNAIVCKLNSAVSNPEGYKLSVRKNLISIEAKTPQGIFYAFQTLRQLLPFQIERPYLSNVAWTVPCLEIEDAPRFGYRGLMLDVCRHFMTKEDVFRYIDMLAYHKMNRFHWHLTDDQGWRIEIKKYPKLTQIGAYRSSSLIGRPSRNKQWDNTPHGGFFTQEDVKQVVAYAARNFITIIPEIEMPGHATAALAAYPELSCSGGPFEVERNWGVFPDIFCPKETTFNFLQDVLSEVIDLFPSEYIHIGGDEAPKTRWQNCAHCQALMKQENLKNEHELQSYFIKHIEKFVESKGRHIIGWDEILEGGLAPNATVMSWRGEAGGIEAAKQGHDVVMAPNSYVYIDYYQANPKTEPLAIGGFLPLWKTYSYEPLPPALTPEQQKHILGLQGNLWTEYIPDFKQAQYMAYPRGAAIAEIGWSPAAKKNYADFKQREIALFKRYDGMGWNYCKAILTEEE
ncbi:MAG: beta-N-acetylhexosaminidase [Dysgonamonadaceae bacterium]|jgi:hexosaminidase|nr:beta-N-acetylhexosaminidase [Dysgonamonadaceae bacterium]